MKKGFIAAGILLTLAAVVFAAGCVGSDAIVGTWESSTLFNAGSTTLSFNADGTGSITGSLFGLSGTTEITWKKVSEGLYSVTSKYASNNIAVTFADDGKSMTFDGTAYMKKA